VESKIYAQLIAADDFGGSDRQSSTRRTFQGRPFDLAAGNKMLTTFSGRKPSQNEFELSSFICLLREYSVQSYLEVGSREGDTFYDVVSSLPIGSRAVALDLPGGMWGKSTTGNQLKKAVTALVAKGYQASYILGDSTADNVVGSILQMPRFDAILIDGDHRYEGAKKDWLNYAPHGSIIAFHDIVGHEQAEKVHGNKVEVPRLWAELKDQYGVVEFVDQGSAMGIGVILPLEIK